MKPSPAFPHQGGRWSDRPLYWPTEKATTKPRVRKSCGRCTNNDHARCVGIGCVCEATDRCARNAALTIEREVCE